MLQMVEVVAKAAVQPAGVKLEALRSAFSLVSSAPLGRKIAEGLKASGVGQALDLDARQLLAAGDLDEECDEELVEAMSAIFGLPVEVADDFSKVSLGADFMVKGGERWMSAIRENLSAISVVVSKWSASRLADEIDPFCEILVQVGVVLSAYDRLRMHQAFNKYGSALMAWDSAFEEYSAAGEWPPAEVKQLVDLQCDFDDEAMFALGSYLEWARCWKLPITLYFQAFLGIRPNRGGSRWPR